MLVTSTSPSPAPPSPGPLDVAAGPARAALLPESLETEFSVVMTTLLVVLIVVIPLVVMIRDARKAPSTPPQPHRDITAAPDDPTDAAAR